MREHTLLVTEANTEQSAISRFLKLTGMRWNGALKCHKFKPALDEESPYEPRRSSRDSFLSLFQQILEK